MKPFVLGLLLWMFSTVPVFAQGTQCPLMGDIDCSDAVTILDLNTLLSKFGSADAAADLNSSGKVNAADLSILISQFGKKANTSPTGVPAPTVIIPTRASDTGDTQGARTQVAPSSSFGDLLD